MPITTPVVVLGANGPIGNYLLKRLAAAGLAAQAISRRPFTAPTGIERLQLDIGNPGDWRLPHGAVVVSFLPLWLLSSFLPRLHGARAIIATGSTSRFSKIDSGDASERDIVAKLENAETALQSWAEANGTLWTVLRPTIIYDGRNDKNIARMARFIRRWRFLPVAAPALGLRQPIHMDDVAKAAFLCIDNPAAANKAFNIAGGEVLTYRAMAERIFVALGQKPLFMPLPTTLLQSAFRLAAKLGILRETGFGASFFHRMNKDLVFEVADGLKAINYQPRDFKPDFSAFLDHAQ